MKTPRPPPPSWLLPLLVLLLCLGMTAAAWRAADRTALQAVQKDFDYQARRIEFLLHQRMATYEQVLRGVQGFARGSAQVDRADFSSYVATLRLLEHYPGIQGLSIVALIPADARDSHLAAMRAQGLADYALHPAGERPLYSSIVQIEPATGMNVRALGYDVLTEPVRRAAMERSRDSGVAALSGKLRLVQEQEPHAQSGIVLYLPVYRRGMPVATVAERRAGLVAWVSAPFRMRDLMANLVGERAGTLRLRIFDGASMADESQLYDSGGAARVADQPLLRAVLPIQIADREWTLALDSTPAFEARFDHGTPLFIAGAGAGISLLLATLVWLLASVRSRARALRESYSRIAAEQQRIRVILENSHDAFIAIDADERITDWNAQAERTFGWSAREAIGRNLAATLVPEDQRAVHLAGFARFLGSGAGSFIENRREAMALHRSGRQIPVEIALAAMPRESGNAATAFVRDISDRREAERSLEEARVALHHAQKLEAVGKLTGGIAHDFNNVLQIISGYLQLMQREAADGSLLQRQLQSALDAVERGARLSSRLLAFARRQPLQPVVVNLCRVLAGMDELLHGALGESVKLSLSAPENLWNTQADRDQLQSVILNLAINARDAMGGVGRLDITLANATLAAASLRSRPDLAPGDYVTLAMHDSGPGMTPEVREHAFEPFFTTKPQGAGTGLGLSMAYGFIAQSGGHIDIGSAPEQGATVRIFLPRSQAMEAETAAVASLAPRGGSEDILVVEDDESVRATVCALLGGLGYRVRSAADAEAALRMLRTGVPADLLFTDVVMPGVLRAPDLVRAALLLRPGLAVLYTSGYTREAVLHGGAGRDAILLPKPYRREQLAQKVRQALAAAAPRDATAPGRRVLVLEEHDDSRQIACNMLSILGYAPHGVPRLEQAQQALASSDYDALLIADDLADRDAALQLAAAYPALRLVTVATAGAAIVQGDSAVALIEKPYRMEKLRAVLG